MADGYFNTPLQDRSRETVERIVAAVEALLERLPFDEITIAQIVHRARCTTGSFYARFPSKDALLPYIYERYNADLRPRLQARLASVDWQTFSLRATCDLFAITMVDMYTERRNLLRAVALFARAHPEQIGAGVRESRGAVTDLPLKVLTRHAAEITHADPVAAARFGFFLIAATAREKLLFSAAPHASDTPVSHAQLEAELGRALYAYLTCN